MGLGLATAGDGDFLPYVNYNAKAGRLYRIDREEVNGEYSNNPVDITDNATFMMDLENIEVGWINFAETGPDYRMVPLGNEIGAKPSDRHKQGFRARIVLSKGSGGKGEVREFASCAACVVKTVSDLHDKFVSANENGKVPVVKLSGTTPQKTKHGTNYIPQLEIASWTNRPDALDATANDAAPEEPEATPSGDKENADIEF